MAPISATADKADDYKAAAVTDKAPVIPTAAAAAMTVTFDRDDIADLKLFWKDNDIAEVLSCEDVPTSPIPLDDAAADPKVIWKEPIDDANGEKHVSQRLRKSRRKHRTRAAKRREKKALQELKQQKDIDLLPALQIRNDDDSSDDDDSDLEPNLLPALMDRNNEDSSGDEESAFELENNRVLNVADKSHPVTKPDPSPGIGHISNPVPDGVPSIDTKVELTSLDNDVDPDISPAAAMTVLNADETRETASDSAAVVAATDFEPNLLSTLMGWNMHKSSDQVEEETIVFSVESTWPNSFQRPHGSVDKIVSPESTAAAEEDGIFGPVDDIVPIDNTIQLDHVHHLTNEPTAVQWIRIDNDDEPNQASTEKGATASDTSTMYDGNDLNVIGRTPCFEINNDGIDLTTIMSTFTQLKSSERSNDNLNPKGTQDKELLGEDISNGRSGHIGAGTQNKAIVICNPAEGIGILGIPVDTRMVNAEVANKKSLVELCIVRDETNPFDSSPNDVQHVSGEPGSDTDVLKDGEHYATQPHHGRDNARRDETASEPYILKEMVPDTVADTSQGIHFVREAKNNGEKKQHPQSLDNHEKFMISLLTENGKPRFDDAIGVTSKISWKDSSDDTNGKKFILPTRLYKHRVAEKEKMKGSPAPDPKAHTAAPQYQIRRLCGPCISVQPAYFVTFRDNGEFVPDPAWKGFDMTIRDKNGDPIWKEFEVTLQDENGDPHIDCDGKARKVLAIPPNDLVSSVLPTKADERDGVKRAQSVLLTKPDEQGEVAEELEKKGDDLIKFKITFDDNTRDDIIRHDERECNNDDDRQHLKLSTIPRYTHTPGENEDRMGSDSGNKSRCETEARSVDLLEILGKDNTGEHTAYGKHNPLEKESWQRSKRIAKLDEHLKSPVMQGKLNHFRAFPPCIYDYEVPMNYKKVLVFDKDNKNNEWKPGNLLEHDEPAEYPRYLGVPVHDVDYVWGDNGCNGAMINNGVTVYDANYLLIDNGCNGAIVNGESTVHEVDYVWGDNNAMITIGTVADTNLQHVPSEYKVADHLTKHWGYQSTDELIRPIFHHVGNTAALYFDDTFEVDRSMTDEDIITINGEC